MEIKIIQSKLIEILDYLHVDGLFPFPIITTKDGKLYSVQTSKDGLAFRYAMFMPEYFKGISKDTESIKVDVEKLRKIVNMCNSKSVVVLRYDGQETENKLVVETERAKNYIALTKLDETETKTGIPFQIKDGVPYLSKGTVPLDTHVVISLKSFKEIDKYLSIHGTEYIKFKMKDDRKLKVIVGDIYGLEDYTVYEPVCKVMSAAEELDVTFTRGIPELAKTFTRDVDIYMRSNFPAWFTETSQSHRFGILLSPVKEE